jgi:hypothetical protein
MLTCGVCCGSKEKSWYSVLHLHNQSHVSLDAVTKLQPDCLWESKNACLSIVFLAAALNLGRQWLLLHECEAQWLHMQDKEKENWVGGVDICQGSVPLLVSFSETRQSHACPDHHACGPLVLSLTHTLFDPNPTLQVVPKQPE